MRGQPLSVLQRGSQPMGDLLETIWATRIIDTHEHILPHQVALQSVRGIDDLVLRTYVLSDLLAAGMPLELWSDAGQDKEAIWRQLQVYLRMVKNTAYFRSLSNALQELHKIAPDGLLLQNWEELSKQVSRAIEGKDWYWYVLHEKAGIDVALQDLGTTDVDRTFFRPVVRMDHFLYGFKRKVRSWRNLPPTLLTFSSVGLEAIEERYETRTRTFDDYLTLLDRTFEQDISSGAVAIKTGIAYDRSLRFEHVGEQEARRVFEKPDEQVTREEAIRFQDSMMHAIVDRAARHGIPIQIHTGIQAGYWSALEDSNPVLLNNLFLEHPDAKFDVFHGGYPYTSELAALAKSFPNVYLNMCWLPLISPTVARRCLHEWIETVPQSKLLWGGDCQIVEETYGHTLVMREIVAQVLKEKVESGYFGLEVAEEIAVRILRQNAIDLYRLRDQKSA